jgi:hypothetical protein
MFRHHGASLAQRDGLLQACWLLNEHGAQRVIQRVVRALAPGTMRRACGSHLRIGEPGTPIARGVAVGFIEGQMTLYRRKLETVEAFHYEAALETMDFKYPFPDWLKDMVRVRENAILQLDTDFGLVWVKPGQWVVKHSRGNLDILDPDEFHRTYKAVSD